MNDTVISVNHFFQNVRNDVPDYTRHIAENTNGSIHNKFWEELIVYFPFTTS
jgi:hypothetical protein